MKPVNKKQILLIDQNGLIFKVERKEENWYA
jgi:hypothetical protein